MGNSGVIYPGLAQRMSAGTGVLHSEKNEIRQRASAFRPDVGGPRRVRASSPGYQQAEIDDSQLTGGLMHHRVGHASDDAADHHPQQERRIARRAAAARRQPSNCPMRRSCTCSSRAATVTLEGAGPLHDGDAVRFTAAGGQRVTATEPSEILVWEMHADLAAA